MGLAHPRLATLPVYICKRHFMERFCSPNEFDQLVELVECGDGTDSLELVSWCVPLVFDATRSIDAQIEQADRILRQWKNKLLKDDRIKRARGMSEKRTLWIRHLRVLDALRTIPKPTDEQIAKILGTKVEKATKEERTMQ